MKLKTVEVNGTVYAAVADGKPVYIADDGTEVPIDGAEAVHRNRQSNYEAQKRREKEEALLSDLKRFEGIDPEAAKKALETLANIDQKKLIDAGEVNKVREQVSAEFRGELEKAVKEAAEAKTALSSALISNAFGTSKFALEKLTPAGVDLIRMQFANRLRVEDGAVVPITIDGQRMVSATNPSGLADFEEGIQKFVDAYPHKDHILKGTGAQGSGARPSNGSPGGAKTMTRAEFDAMPQAERAAKFKEGFKVI